MINKKHETINESVQIDTFQDYLDHLQICVDIHERSFVKPDTIIGLLNDKNNLTNGVKYTKEQLKSTNVFNEYTFFSVNVREKISYLDMAGLIGIKNGVVEIFVLSSYAVGKGVLNHMLSFITNKKVKFTESPYNRQLQEKLKLNGFELMID